MSAQNWVDIGRIAGVFGIKGWIKVYSYTDPKENILNYNPWYLSGQGATVCYHVVDGTHHGKGIIVKLKAINSREDAAKLNGQNIVINRDQFGPSGKDQYYWIDLTGLNVVTGVGQVLGKVDSLIETGANDVLVVKGERERLIPFIQGQFVKKVDMEAGEIIVDWDPEF